MRVRLRLGLVALAALALVAPLPASGVERVYAQGFFPRLQPLVTWLSNLTAVAWFDVLLVGVLVGVVRLLVRDVRARGAMKAAGWLVLRFLTVAAVAYLAFLFTWGLNYRRAALTSRVTYDTRRVTPESAAHLAREAAAQLNAAHQAAHGEGWPGLTEVDETLASEFRTTLVRLGLPASIRPARPKVSLLDLYFRRAGVAGMTDPYFLETLIASDTLPFERSQVVAHEWAHLAGITDEGEANFVGWLTCASGSSPNRYSGWLFLYSEVMSGLPPDVARAIAATLGEGPRTDLRAIRERHAREVSPRLAGAGWQIYDGYLRANRVEAGTASYAEVVRLVLGTGLRGTARTEASGF